MRLLLTVNLPVHSYTITLASFRTETPNWNTLAKLIWNLESISIFYVYSASRIFIKCKFFLAEVLTEVSSCILVHLLPIPPQRQKKQPYVTWQAMKNMILMQSAIGSGLSVHPSACLCHSFSQSVSPSARPSVRLPANTTPGHVKSHVYSSFFYMLKLRCI